MDLSAVDCWALKCPLPRAGGGVPACKDRSMLFLSTAPHGRGSDSRTGARCAHTGPGHTAARRIAQQPA